MISVLTAPFSMRARSYTPGMRENGKEEGRKREKRREEEGGEEGGEDGREIIASACTVPLKLTNIKVEFLIAPQLYGHCTRILHKLFIKLDPYPLQRSIPHMDEIWIQSLYHNPPLPAARG
jgi:hypothetical protein